MEQPVNEPTNLSDEAEMKESVTMLVNGECIHNENGEPHKNLDILLQYSDTRTLLSVHRLPYMP